MYNERKERRSPQGILFIVLIGEHEAQSLTHAKYKLHTSALQGTELYPQPLERL